MSSVTRLAIVLACLAATTRPAHADAKADADALVREGATLAGAGKLDDAIARFKAAEALFPRALHQCNLGVAYAKLKRPDRAHRYFTTCRTASTAAEWKTISATAEAVEKELKQGGYAPLTLVIDPGDALVTASTLADDEAFTARDITRLWVPLGDVTIRATRDGLGPQTTSITVDKPTTVTLTLYPAPTAVPSVAQPEPPSTGSGQAQPVSSSSFPRRTIAYATLGAGAALLATGVWAHLSALDRLDHAETLPPGPAFDDATDAYHSRRTLAYALYAVGAATAGVGTYLFLTSGSSATVTPTDDGATVWLTGRFE